MTLDTLKLIQEYRQRFVGSTAEQIVLDACENEIRFLRDERDEAKRELESLNSLLDDYRHDLDSYRWREVNDL